jgi:hypothetical protein
LWSGRLENISLGQQCSYDERTEEYAVYGKVDNEFKKLALGTEDEKVAIRRVEKIKTGCAVGSRISGRA